MKPGHKDYHDDIWLMTKTGVAGAKRGYHVISRNHFRNIIFDPVILKLFRIFVYKARLSGQIIESPCAICRDHISTLSAIVLNDRLVKLYLSLVINKNNCHKVRSLTVLKLFFHAKNLKTGQKIT